MNLQPEQLAWFLLEAVNRTQARGRTAQLVVPRDPEIVSELGRELNTAPTEEELVSAEEYLERHGYVALSDFQLSRATYTITTTGLDWLNEGLPWRPEVPQTAAGEQQGRRAPSLMPEALRRAHRACRGGVGCSGVRKERCA